MNRQSTTLAILVVALLSASNASAGVWFELLHGPCWTGDENDINQDDGVVGEYNGAIDCFNKDFNGDGARTTLSIKAFQPWEYGTVFVYYDITGPFSSAIKNVTSDFEKGGFFGGVAVTFSSKAIAKRITGNEAMDWGVLGDVHLRLEMEQISKLGGVQYVGLQYDFVVPFLDFLSLVTVIREDWAFEGVDLQLGGATQKSFSLGSQDFIVGGFFGWAVFGEGEGKGPLAGRRANNFFATQPQILWDFGKLIRFTPAKLYLGLEYQFTVNRYLIEGKSENMLQGMIRWNI